MRMMFSMAFLDYFYRFSEDEIDIVFGCLSAILLLGNVEFVGEEGDAGEAARVEDKFEQHEITKKTLLFVVFFL